jgi:hypothetical protein
METSFEAVDPIFDFDDFNLLDSTLLAKAEAEPTLKAKLDTISAMLPAFYKSEHTR